MPVDFEAAKDGELTVKSNGLFKKTFKFDAVFSPQAGQGSNKFCVQACLCL
jgi:kinesin family member C2/C3